MLVALVYIYWPDADPVAVALTIIHLGLEGGLLVCVGEGVYEFRYEFS